MLEITLFLIECFDDDLDEGTGWSSYLRLCLGGDVIAWEKDLSTSGCG